jgi:hypothetical protein
MWILKGSGFIKSIQNSSDGNIHAAKYNPVKCLGFNWTHNKKKMC